VLPIVRSAWTIRHGLAAEFGLVAVRCVAAAVLLLAGFFVFRTLATLAIGAPVLIERGGASNVVVALGYLTLGLVLNFTLGALVVMRLVFRLRHLSHHDPLTQLLNRRGLEHALAQERQRQRRHGRPMALLALDLDHFKSINDRHGHGAGDQVLVQVAALLRAQCRGGDLAARTGGEEFLMLLPDTDLAGARQAAERLLHTLREHPLTAGGERLSVTSSIGVAVTDDPREELIGLWRRLDRALYRAKDQGRDRAVLAEGLSPPA
jgi:diguanylate cyclase (GGDEF)-like protein